VNEPRSDAGDAELIDRLYEVGDDAELDGLRMVRGLVARVRDEMPGVEPPQAISARLLQAAALPTRAAAVEPAREGLWARFRAWFAGVAMHPGMAAAVTLVIVAGAAAIWMRQGGKAATPTVSTEPTAAEQDRGVDAPEPPAPPALAGSKDVAPVEVQREAVTDDGDERDVRPADKAPPRKAPPPKPKPTTPAPDDDSTGGASSGSGSGGFVDQTDKTTVTTKVGGKKTTEDSVRAPPAPPPSEGPSPDSDDEGGAPSDSEMARALTRQATAAAKKQDCESVEYFGKKVKALDPDYYATSFVTQRDIAACRPVSK